MRADPEPCGPTFLTSYSYSTIHPKRTTSLHTSARNGQRRPTYATGSPQRPSLLTPESSQETLPSSQQQKTQLAASRDRNVLSSSKISNRSRSSFLTQQSSQSPSKGHEFRSSDSTCPALTVHVGSNEALSNNAREDITYLQLLICVLGGVVPKSLLKWARSPQPR